MFGTRVNRCRMPSTPSDPSRFTVAEMVADLRESAEDLAEDLIGIPPQDTNEGQAAQTLEEFEAALTWIAGGVPDPQAIARDALSLSASLKPIGDADDTIRKLLKPKRT
ncbi:hypothetical protein [Methylobacterium komagatae]